MKVTGTE